MNKSQLNDKQNHLISLVFFFFFVFNFYLRLLIKPFEIYFSAKFQISLKFWKYNVFTPWTNSYIDLNYYLSHVCQLTLSFVLSSENNVQTYNHFNWFLNGFK